MNVQSLATTRPELPASISNALVDPAVHASEQIHELFSWMRANEPLGVAVADGFDPFWVVTRQRELRAIAMRPDLFGNGDRLVLVDKASELRMQQLLDGRRFPIRTILHMDPPEHSAYRALTADYFHARSVDTLTETIRDIAREFVDGMLERDGWCDFAKDVAFLYPLRVVMNIMGVPREDEPEMLRLTQQFFGSSDEEFSRVGESETAGDALAAVAAEFNAYFDSMLADRRANPRDDVVSALANGRIDGAPLPQLEARSYCAHLATAGHETTASVTAGAMLALCRDPELFARVKADGSLVTPLIEEAARFATPSKITMRTVSEDTEFCDRHFRKGDWMAMAWASGSRDESVIEDPHRFSIDRKPNKLISYGNGPHVCLGQHLARLEMRLLLAEIVQRVDSVALAGEPKWMESLIVSGLKTLPISFKAS